MKLVNPDYVYEESAAVPTDNDHEVAKAIHEVVQAVRVELAEDDDTPGKLTAEELLAIAIQKVPGAAIVIVNSIKDGMDVLDIESVGHCLVHNLVDGEGDAE
jgi:hypothetical protein